jgi:hypothetical protein
MMPWDHNIMQKYLDRTLTEAEKKFFRQALENNEDLRRTVALLENLRKGIRLADNRRLEEAIRKRLPLRKQFVPFPLKLLIGFLLLAGTGIIFWKYEPHVSENLILEESLENQPPQSYLPSEAPKDLAEEVIPEPEPVSRQEPARSLPISQDRLLISTSLKPVAITLEPGIEAEPALSDDDLYHLEFWVSPVNYRGYKLLGRKLMLYGIGEPDAVQLYVLEQELWMKYHNDFIPLESSGEFQSFNPAQEQPFELR